jgi:hypothetical protein
MTAPYTEGSILQFTPATDTAYARFETKSGESWTELILGWAVYVRWVRDNEDEPAVGDMETGIIPVLLDMDGYPATLREYLLDRDAEFRGVMRRV